VFVHPPVDAVELADGSSSFLPSSRTVVVSSEMLVAIFHATPATTQPMVMTSPKRVRTTPASMMKPDEPGDITPTRL